MLEATTNSFDQYADLAVASEQSGVVKQALINPFTIPTRARDLMNSLSKDPRYQRELYAAMDSLDDPAERDNNIQIRVRSMLNDFLSNDPVISGYDPDEVLEYFNELVRLNPNLADQPAVMRGTLRRTLQQGHIEPFEAGQVNSIGNDIAKGKQLEDPENVKKLLEENKLKGEAASPGRISLRSVMRDFKALTTGGDVSRPVSDKYTLEQRSKLEQMALEKSKLNAERSYRARQQAFQELSEKALNAREAEKLRHASRENLLSRQAQGELTDKQLASQEGIASRALTSQEGIASRALTSQEGIAEKNRGSQESIAEKGRDSQEGIASRAITSQEGIAEKNRGSQEGIASRALTSQEGIAGRQLNFETTKYFNDYNKDNRNYDPNDSSTWDYPPTVNDAPKWFTAK